MTKKLILIILVFLLINLTGCVEGEMTDEQLAMLVTFDDLNMFDIGDFETESCESYMSKTNIDGSLEIEYEFDSAKNGNNRDYLLISSQVEVNESIREAKESFRLTIDAFRLGLSISNKSLKLVEDKELFKWGDEYYSSYIVANDNIVGNLITARKDNKIFSLILMGIYFDDKDLLMELLGSKLSFISEYN
jgi:hypothetical protein